MKLDSSSAPEGQSPALKKALRPLDHVQTKVINKKIGIRTMKMVPTRKGVYPFDPFDADRGGAALWSRNLEVKREIPDRISASYKS
jgi:hypothetical protein